MNPKVPIVRFYLLWTAACCLAWVYPECGIVLLGAGLGWWPGCGCCSIATTCTFCTPGLDPGLDMQVEVSGIADDWCTNCSALDGTYVLPLASISPTECSYVYEINPNPLTCSGYSQFVVRLLLDLNTSSQLVFSMQKMCNDPNGFLNWRNSYGGAEDCTAWVDESVTYLSRAQCDPPFGSNYPCVGSGATVLVTPV